MALNKPADRPGKNHHEQNGDNNGGNHNADLVNHADGRNHRIQGEDGIEQENLDDYAREGRRDLGRRMSFLAF